MPPVNGHCSIYPDRPNFCKEYPHPADFRPLKCTYSFKDDGARQGECDPTVCGTESCCNLPRGSGLSSGQPTESFSPRGLPCLHVEGLEGHSASTRYTQITHHELWSGALHIRRLLDSWEISEISPGPVARTVCVPEDVFWHWMERARTEGAGLHLQIPLPDRAFTVDLTQAELAYLPKLRPDTRPLKLYPDTSR